MIDKKLEHKKRIGYQRIYIELKNQGIKIEKTNYRRYNSYKGELIR